MFSTAPLSVGLSGANACSIGFVFHTEPGVSLLHRVWRVRGLGDVEGVMLKHQFYQYVILKHALSECSGSLGRSTTWPTLDNLFRAAGLETVGSRASMDALMLLSTDRKIVLKKIHASNHSFDYVVYDYAEYPMKDHFFWGQFNIYVTVEGAAHFEELEAKAHAMMQAASSAAPAKPKRIGFHA